MNCEAGPAASAYTQATRLGLADEAAGAKVPWLTEALYNLGNLESSRNNDGGACRAWNQYLARNPTNQALINEVKRLMLGLRGC